MRHTNENLLTLSKAYITLSEPLENGEDVAILIKGNVTEIKLLDQQDGTDNRVHVVKGIIAEVIAKDGTKSLEANKVQRKGVRPDRQIRRGSTPK